MGEITEEQFGVITAMCKNSIAVACIPDLLPDDPEHVRQNHAHHMETFANLEANGFVTNISDKYTAAIAEVQAEQQAKIDAGEEATQLLRGFSAFCVTEMAFNMFHAPEGPVN